MKSTKTILAVAIVIAGFASFSCGSDVAGSVSIADAYDECNLFDMLDIGEPLSDGEFNTLLIQAETFRDEGGSRGSYISWSIDTCSEPDVASNDDARAQCVVCLTAVGAVVWP